MKTISMFILLIYWSLIILAPVLAKNTNYSNGIEFLKPIEKPKFTVLE